VNEMKIVGGLSKQTKPCNRDHAMRLEPARNLKGDWL
jgi:hypothetical protein